MSDLGLLQLIEEVTSSRVKNKIRIFAFRVIVNLNYNKLVQNSILLILCFRKTFIARTQKTKEKNCKIIIQQLSGIFGY